MPPFYSWMHLFHTSIGRSTADKLRQTYRVSNATAIVYRYADSLFRTLIWNLKFMSRICCAGMRINAHSERESKRNYRIMSNFVALIVEWSCKNVKISMVTGQWTITEKTWPLLKEQVNQRIVSFYIANNFVAEIKLSVFIETQYFLHIFDYSHKKQLITWIFKY